VQPVTPLRLIPTARMRAWWQSVVVFVEAKDPSDGATVVLKCWTRGEVLATVKCFRAECLEGIKATDINGTLIPEIDL
jgi:hypothetical protein